MGIKKPDDPGDRSWMDFEGVKERASTIWSQFEIKMAQQPETARTGREGEDKRRQE